MYMCLNVIMKNARKIVPKVQLPVDYLAQEIEKTLYQFYEKRVLFEVQKHPLTLGEYT